MPVSNRFLDASKAATRTASTIGTADPSADVSDWLDFFDSKWARVDAAFQRLKRACG
jgi:hypothetical protein